MKTQQIGLSLEQLRANSRRMKNEPDTQTEYKAWLSSEPEHVVQFAHNFDLFVPYFIKDKAPYKMTGPGTIGVVIGLNDDGMAIFMAHVIVYNPEKLTDKELKITEALTSPLQTYIAPKWLEPIPEIN